MKKYIGIDIGTTTICAVCLDEAGRILLCDKRPNRTVEFARQDPDEILASIRKLVRGMMDEQGEIQAIGISTQMHGMVYVDEQGKACSPLYTWQDTHGNDSISEDMREVLEEKDHVDKETEAGYTGTKRGYTGTKRGYTGTKRGYTDTKRGYTAAEPNDGGMETYCSQLSRITGYSVATGYGLCTHYYHLKNNLVPEHAHKICTIGDYAAMQLCGLKEPVMHPSNGAGFGMFDTCEKNFDLDAVSRSGIDVGILPKISKERILGTTPEGIKVWIAIGDNQASVYGSVPVEGGIPTDGIQITVGTSAQITFVTDENLSRQEEKMQESFIASKQEKKIQELSKTSKGEGKQPDSKAKLEVRPFLGGKQLLVGAALCGGFAYQLVRDFFAETLSLFCSGADNYPESRMNQESRMKPESRMNQESQANRERWTANLYTAMNRAAEKVYESGKCVPAADTRFLGSRSNPSLSGAFTGIRPDIFHPGEMCLAVLKGIVEELYQFYLQKDADEKIKVIYGSGNGLRQNPLLVKLLEERFGRKILLSEITEEAAYGAGKFAMTQENM